MLFFDFLLLNLPTDGTAKEDTLSKAKDLFYTLADMGYPQGKEDADKAIKLFEHRFGFTTSDNSK